MLKIFTQNIILVNTLFLIVKINNQQIENIFILDFHVLLNLKLLELQKIQIEKSIIITFINKLNHLTNFVKNK